MSRTESYLALKIYAFPDTYIGTTTVHSEGNSSKWLYLISFRERMHYRTLHQRSISSYIDIRHRILKYNPYKYFYFLKYKKTKDS